MCGAHPTQSCVCQTTRRPRCMVAAVSSRPRVTPHIEGDVRLGPQPLQWGVRWPTYGLSLPRPALTLAVRRCGQDVAGGLWVFALLGLTT